MDMLIFIVFLGLSPTPPPPPPMVCEPEFVTVWTDRGYEPALVSFGGDIRCLALAGNAPIAENNWLKVISGDYASPSEVVPTAPANVRIVQE